MLLMIYVAVVAPVRRLFGPPETVVLLYHRISDDFSDPLTVGVKQFEKQMEWLRNNYAVSGLDELLEGEGGGVRVMVTFDDGYLDNYQNGAKTLKKLNIPGAFFVTTDFIGAEDTFPHDKDNVGFVPSMSWEQVNELHSDGFVIGSHTCSHIDCGTEPLEKIAMELAKSKEILEEELGASCDWFALPFGKDRSCRTEVVDELKRLGYKGCLFAFGGINRGKIDPYRILRVGVNCNFSMLDFKARLAGYQFRGE